MTIFFWQGQGFTIAERQYLGIHGLLPPRVSSQDEQCQIIYKNFHRFENDLDKYIYLMSLLDRNEKIFYRFAQDNIEEVLPIIYTPTVGLACQKYGLIHRRPKYVLSCDFQSDICWCDMFIYILICYVSYSDC